MVYTDGEEACRWSSGESAQEVRYMAIDPVCKMTVDEKTAPAKSEYKGTTYYFCAMGCKKAFDKDPEKYLGK